MVKEDTKSATALALMDARRGAVKGRVSISRGLKPGDGGRSGGEGLDSYGITPNSQASRLRGAGRTLNTSTRMPDDGGGSVKMERWRTTNV